MIRVDPDGEITFMVQTLPGRSQTRWHGTMVPVPDRGPVGTHWKVDHDDTIESIRSGQLVTVRGLPQRAAKQNRRPEERAMNRHVWISDCRGDPTLIKMVETDIAEENFELGLEAAKLILKGQTVPVTMLPKVFWCDRSGMNSFPDLFRANDYWIVSRQAGEIIKKFDLGNGGLYPVQGFKKDRKTAIEGEFLCLNVGAQKSVFLPDRSPRSEEFSRGYIWSLPTKDKNNALIVSNAALDGPDLWYDPRIYNGFFLSAPLGDALKDAGMAEAFRLHRCSVLEG